MLPKTTKTQKQSSREATLTALEQTAWETVSVDLLQKRTSVSLAGLSLPSVRGHCFVLKQEETPPCFSHSCQPHGTNRQYQWLLHSSSHAKNILVTALGLPTRILEWVASSRRSSPPRDQTHISYVFCIGRQILYHQRHLGSPQKGYK